MKQTTNQQKKFHRYFLNSVRKLNFFKKKKRTLTPKSGKPYILNRLNALFFPWISFLLGLIKIIKPTK